MLVTTLVNVGFLATSSNPLKLDYMYYIVRSITMVLALVVVRLEFLKSIHSSGIFFMFWLLQLICDVIIFRSWIIREHQVSDVEQQQFITYCTYFGLVCLMFVLHLFADKQTLNWTNNTAKLVSDEVSESTPLLEEDVQIPKKADGIEVMVDVNNKKTLPELYTPFWSRATYFWMLSEIYSGYRKAITFDMLYNIRPWETCHRLIPKFYHVFNRHKSEGPLSMRNETGIKRQRNSFLWSIFMAGGNIIILGSLINLASLAVRVMQPFILGGLITYIESGDPYLWKGIFLAVSLFVVSVLNSLLLHAFMYCVWVGGMRCRTLTNAVVYRKALRLSGSAKKLTTIGEVLNLMSVDAQKIQDAWVYGNVVWEVPMEILASTTLIWQVVGPSSLAGIAVLCVIMPLNGFYAGNWVKKLQISQMKHKDVRIKYMSEIISGIKVIKLYAWEIPFLDKVFSTRNRELYYLKLANLIGAFSNTIWFLTPYMVSLAVFTTFVLVSPTNILDPNKAFVTLSLINVMNFTISILPIGVSFLGQAIVSIRRIDRFLDMEELEEGMVEQVAGLSDAISIEAGTFSWEKDGRIVLREINLNLPRGHLVAVVGHVGSGKTSLVSALLGEMVKSTGHIKIDGSIAYVPQQAWIQNATLRSNVIFGKAFNSKRYNAILEATALVPDLRTLADGDLTEIGEKGINLSGGQKQRVSLARAIYQDEDLYLLDDPLSAVDAHVGKHIFENVISNKGLLKNKTRILVTHGISFLRHVDVVVVMNNGAISEMGHYDDLIEHRGAFAEFLKNYFNDTVEYSSAEEEDIASIRDHFSAVSAEEAGNLSSSKHDKPKHLRKRNISRSASGLETSITTRSSSKVSESNPGKLIEEEMAEQGSVQNAIIRRYITAGGTILFYLVIVFILLFTISQVLTNLWLSDWTADVPDGNGTMDGNLLHFRIGIYGALGVVQGVCAAVLLTACAVGCLSASNRLHIDIISRLLHAPMAFFDTTPLGRILNRCSKDMDVVDSNMPIQLRGFFFCLGPVVSTAFVITYTTPIFLAACVPIAIVYILGQRMYIGYVRQLKRIDNIRRSPIYAHFDETINGTSSIRAYGRQWDFTEKCDRLIDESQKPFYMILVAQRWLGFTMETIGALITFFAALFAVLSRDVISGGMAGLSVSYSLNITIMMNGLIRCMSELETYMVSVERVDEYCHINQEADWQNPETEPNESWPAEGEIHIDGYGTRYRPGLDLILQDLTCDIQAGEKIGIVGRTGAGKSSLALALFRIIEAAKGSITIDGVPIASLGLHSLRSHLTIIPQEPVIFSGTLRQNLDPLEKHNDKLLWEALERAHLGTFVHSLSEGLDYECGEGGESLSVGQRQLVCLARAVLRHTRVLVLDEATAAVDLETDSLIQATIRDLFSQCTVLTIAHRLATVMDYDRIMVLDHGSVQEFDSPKRLLSQTSSIFHSLAKEAGII